MSDIATLRGLRCPNCGSDHLKVTGTKGAMGAAVATGMAFGAIGNLVAGSNAAANQETRPLQYKCVSCGHKFESLPLAAPQEDILLVPCTVTFVRESSFVGAAVPQIVYINGVKIGSVKNGKSVTFQTANRYNAMFVTDQYGVAFQSEYRFEAQPGGNILVRFNRKFLDAQNPPPAASLPPGYGPPAAYAPPASAAVQVKFCLSCGEPLPSDQMFCSNCGTKRFVPENAAPPPPTYGGPGGGGVFQPSAATVQPPANHMRAVWTAVIFAAGWVCLLLLQGLFGRRLIFSADTAWFSVAALLAVGTYLLVQKGAKYKVLGIAAGLFAAVLSAGSTLATAVNSQKLGAFSLGDALNFGAPLYGSNFWRALIFASLTLLSAFVVGLLMGKKSEKSRTLTTGATAALVYGLSSLVWWLIQYGRQMGRMSFASLFSLFTGFVSDALFLFFAVWILYCLCRAKTGRIRLYGLGKVWVWLATIGMIVSIAIPFAVAFKGISGIAYTASLMLAVAGTVGYIMLLMGRRMGLYVIVFAALLISGAQFFGSLCALVYGANIYVSLLVGSVGGGVNTLFAWFAVRQADGR